MNKEGIEKAFEYIEGCLWIEKENKDFLKGVILGKRSREFLLIWNQGNKPDTHFLDELIVGEGFWSYEDLLSCVLYAFDIPYDVITSLGLKYMW